MSEVKVTHNKDEARYEARIDDALAGFIEYRLTDQIIVMSHTEVDPTFEGQGVGSALARFALDDVEADGKRRVLPTCPFIKGWIHKHPEYAKLVYGVAPQP
mgnify:CR=1 FL=1